MMNNNKEASKPKDKEQQDRKKKGPPYWKRKGQGQSKEKDPEAIPVLKYGPANNFMLFREALSNRALKDYGALGKMIKQGMDYKEPQEPRVDDYNLEDDEYGINKARFIEDLKDYRKEITN